MKTTTTVVWRSFLHDPPTKNFHFLIAEADEETPHTGTLIVSEVCRWNGEISYTDGGMEINEPDERTLWAELPLPSIREPVNKQAFSSAELWQAIVRGGYDLTLCKGCGKPVVCLPDGMGAYCDGCQP